jgi:hypothetical protein
MTIFGDGLQMGMMERNFYAKSFPFLSPFARSTHNKKSQTDMDFFGIVCPVLFKTAPGK